MVVVNDPSGFVVAFESGTLSRFQPLGPMRFPLAVTKNSPTSVLAGRPVAFKVVCERTVPQQGFKVGTAADAGLMLIAVFGVWLLSRASRSLSGYWSLSGGGPASLVTLNAKRYSCLLSR